MSQPRLGSGTSTDRGAYAVMYAVLSTVLIGVTSIVIDLAALRLDRRADRAAADAAAIAGAGQLGELGENAAAACRRALEYLSTTLDGDFDTGGCAALPAVCDPLTSQTVTPPANDGRTVTITWPVPDGDDLLTLADVEGSASADASATLGSLDPESDGEACQRLGVQISHNRGFAFGGIFGGSGATTASHSVGLALRNSVGNLPVPVVALSESACAPLGLPAIDVGVGTVRVGGSATGPPGEIAVDADGSTCSVVRVDDGLLQSDRVGIFLLGAAASYPRVDADLLSRAWRVTDRPWRDRYNCAQPSAVLCGKPSDAPTPLTYVDLWKSYGSGLALTVGSQPDPPERDGSWTVIDDPLECATPQPVYNTDVYADCNTLTITASTFNGRLVTRQDVDVVGAATFAMETHVGGDLTIDDSASATTDLVVAGELILNGELTVSGTLDVGENVSVDESAAQLDVAVSMVARRNFFVNDGGQADIDGPVHVKTDFLITDSVVEVAGAARIGHHLELHEDAVGTFTSLVLVVDDLDLQERSLLRTGGPLVAQNQQMSGDPIRGIRLGGSACLVVASGFATANCVDPLPASSTDASNIFVNGDLSVLGTASVVVHRAFTYVAGRMQATTDGKLHFFSATNATVCLPTATPITAACFEDLAIWADGSAADHNLRVGSDDTIEGTVFAPGGDLTTQWNDNVQVNHAQFVAERLIFVGSDATDTLTIRPDAERSTLIPQSAGTLIR